MAERVLVRETEWSREYRLGPDRFSLESKFAKDGLEVSAAFIRDNWGRWSPADRLAFVNAFILKPALTPNDQRILQYLMEVAEEPVSATIAFLMPRYQDRAAAFTFLVRRAAAAGPFSGAYFQALERIGDPRAVPVLRSRFEDYRNTLAPFDRQGLHGRLADYQQCCRALWKLTNSPEYEDALQELLRHPADGIRRRSQYLLAKP
jgi:hypothetical protein